MAIYDNSRYLKTQPYTRSGNIVVLDTRKRYSFNLENAIHYTIREGDNIDLIAHKFYGNAQLWWAIMDSNRIYQSELDLKVGDIITIPPYEEVLKVL